MTGMEHIRRGLMGGAFAVALASPGVAEPLRDLSQPVFAVAGYEKARLIGHWFEVARTPSMIEPDCKAVTTDVEARDDSRLTLKLACHKGSVDGPVLRIEGILAETDPGIFALRFVRPNGFGGLTLVVLSQADDDSLAVLGTPGGQIGWVWSKTPEVDPETLARGRDALVAAGYRAGAIQPVAQVP